MSSSLKVSLFVGFILTGCMVIIIHEINTHRNRPGRDIEVTYHDGSTDKAFTQDTECYLDDSGCLKCDGDIMACGVRKFRYLNPSVKL